MREYTACLGEVRNAYEIFGRKIVGNKTLTRRQHRWENNFRLFVRELAWEGVD
jgi:hypothetical protein